MNEFNINDEVYIQTTGYQYSSNSWIKGKVVAWFNDGDYLVEHSTGTQRTRFSAEEIAHTEAVDVKPNTTSSERKTSRKQGKS